MQSDAVVYVTRTCCQRCGFAWDLRVDEQLVEDEQDGVAHIVKCPACQRMARLGKSNPPPLPPISAA